MKKFFEKVTQTFRTQKPNLNNIDIQKLIKNRPKHPFEAATQEAGLSIENDECVIILHPDLWDTNILPLPKNVYLSDKSQKQTFIIMKMNVFNEKIKPNFSTK